MLYTGGTTGMPKGVMYDMASHVGLFLRSGLSRSSANRCRAPARRSRHSFAAITDAGNRMIAIPCAPLMHGTGLWLGAFAAHLTGGEVITLTSRTLDPHEVLRTAQERRATSLVIVGDAFAKPIGRCHRRGGATRRTLRPVEHRRDPVVRRDVDDRGQRAAARADPAGRALRCDRFDRGFDGQPDEHARRIDRDGQVHPEPDDEGVHRGRS